MLIQRASLLGNKVVDIRLGEQIEQVAESLRPLPGELVLDAGFGTVLPGLHDHHLHVYSAAAELNSVRVGPQDVRDSDGLAQALTRAVPGADGWIRAVGYHDTVAGPLDRDLLDALAPPNPIRVQHRSGMMWTLNSAGLAAVGLADHPDGRLRSADRAWSDVLERTEPPLDAFSAGLAAYGVTGVTDATPDLDITVRIRQRVHVLAPGKRILHDDALDLDALITWISDRHTEGIPVALHCVTAAQLVVAIAALRVAGRYPGDRIEHAAMVPADCIADLAGLGVTVVTQPNFVAERGDQYRTDVPATEQDQLWRLASLRYAGVPVALSTDAPFGDSDPWAAMRAAVHRRSPTGQVLNAAECVDARTALTLFLGSATQPARPRTHPPGQPADLCVLSAPPREALGQLDAGLVVATVIGGAMVFTR
jgi:predicted amidohydrolase YtcJ